jgi:hypothetical protein
MDSKIMKKAQKRAFAEGVSFSAWVQKAVADQLHKVLAS